MASFQPRLSFPNLSSLTVPRSYFLGHHSAGLERMRGMMNSNLIDLIIEVRDYRTPLTSRNPLFEQLLLGGGSGPGSSRPRLVMYTKRDLGVAKGRKGVLAEADRARERLITEWVQQQQQPETLNGKNNTTAVMFGSGESQAELRQIVSFCKNPNRYFRQQEQKQQKGEKGQVLKEEREEDGAEDEHEHEQPEEEFGNHLFGTRVLVVGMPNVGKSTLINGLRRYGSGMGRSSRVRRKVAKTGDQPGVTRKIGTAIKIVAQGEPNKNGQGGALQNVYVLDTPGVFVPYVGDAESMLKLALCGNVKDGIVPPVTLADYLLYHINLQGWHSPPPPPLPPSSSPSSDAAPPRLGRLGETETGPEAYRAWSPPTNDIGQVLRGLAQQQGRLKKQGEIDYEAAAMQFIHRWRAGELGRFVLDEVNEDTIRRYTIRPDNLGSTPSPTTPTTATTTTTSSILTGGSWNQARKAIKAQRKLKTR